MLGTEQFSTATDALVRAVIFHLHVFPGEGTLGALFLGYMILFGRQPVAQLGFSQISFGLFVSHATRL